MRRHSWSSRASFTGNRFGTATLPVTLAALIHELSPQSNGTWTEKPLAVFNGNNGNVSLSGLVFDNAGNLYGTSATGGDGAGNVFEVVP